MNSYTNHRLSKMDIKAMKQADRVCFSSHRGEARIRCIKVVSNHGPYDDREREYEIPASTTVVAYDLMSDDGRSANVTDQATCFAMFHGTHRDYYPWAAIVALCREGDELLLSWCADGSNGYQKDAAKRASEVLHHDKLTLTIRRDSSTKFLFYLCDSHCPDNSARMIRNYRIPSLEVA